MKVHNLDHMVITANNLEKTIEFYTSVLGMELQTFSDERKALILGSLKINLHERGKALKPQAQNPLRVLLIFVLLPIPPSHRLFHI